MERPDSLLRELCEQSGVVITGEQCSLIVRLLGLVEKWGVAMHLTSIWDVREAVVRHALDSLLIARVVRAPRSFVDVGSGNGFPGMALAVLWPEAEAHLADSRQKACVFLSEAARELGLANVRLWRGRAETGEVRRRLSGQPLVVSRGLTPRGSTGAVLGPLVGEDGVAVAYTGREGVGEAAATGFADEGLRYRKQEVVAAGGTQWERRFDVYARTTRPKGLVRDEPLECFT